MAIQVKKFEFLPFDEWHKRNNYYKGIIGKYTVEIYEFSNYYKVYTDFPLEHIKWLNFDEKQDMSLEEQLENLRVWYEEACVKVNKGFEEYIRTYLI